LDNYYVQPICTPTRGTLMSGRLPIHTGLQHEVIEPATPYGLPLNFTLLPEQLKKKGYSTHLVGKWHLGIFKQDYYPMSRGFDTYYGLMQGGGDYYAHTAVAVDDTGKLYQGVDFFNGTTADFSKNGTYSSLTFTEEAIRIINQKNQNSPPMFMYVAMQNGHDPYEVPDIYKDQYSHIENEDRRALAGQITMMDESVGNITAALKRNGLWENTIFIFSSDNGAPTQSRGKVGSNYPYRGQKATVWEGGTKVAGLVSGPKAPTHRAVYKGLMHMSDWYPTILRAAGIQKPRGLTLDGFDQWTAMKGIGQSPRTEILYNIDPLATQYGVMKEESPFDNRIQAALRMGDMKLLTGDPTGGLYFKPVYTDADVAEGRAAGALERRNLRNADPSDIQNIFLFNITADPYETTDLSLEKPEIVTRMLSRLAEYYAGSVPPGNQPAEYAAADPSLNGGAWQAWL